MKRAEFTRPHNQKRGLALALVTSMSFATPAVADEGGVSFWVPGLFGSLAAVPQQPGFSSCEGVRVAKLFLFLMAFGGSTLVVALLLLVIKTP